MYIYKGDVYCGQCGEVLRNYLRITNQAPPNPEDETAYESDRYPKPGDESEPADIPRHCHSGHLCLNRVSIGGGMFIGALLGQSLTAAGRAHVRGVIAGGKVDVSVRRRAVARFWEESFVHELVQDHKVIPAMIGGEDVIFDVGFLLKDCMSACLEAVLFAWPDAVWQDAHGMTYSLRIYPDGWGEVLVYRSKEAMQSWFAHGAVPENANTMVHILVGDRVTVVVDNKDSPEMNAILTRIGIALKDLKDSYRPQDKPTGPDPNVIISVSGGVVNGVFASPHMRLQILDFDDLEAGGEYQPDVYVPLDGAPDGPRALEIQLEAITLTLRNLRSRLPNNVNEPDKTA